MTMHQRNRLHDLRIKHGLGLELTPPEYQELLNLQAKEHVARQESIEHAEPEIAAIGMTGEAPRG